jgi:sulfate transport system substrate-binding protein
MALKGNKRAAIHWRFLLIVALAALWGCAGGATPAASTAEGSKLQLILAAYTTPREAYGEIIPLFQKQWKDKTGQDVEFQESYLGSGAQSRAVVGGFEADVVALSLEADVTRIAEAGMITHDWKSKGANGMVSDSVAVIAVRQGNPKNIRDWQDLTQPGLEILTPDPASSGGAQWNVMALWGAATRGFVDGYTKGDDNAARQFLKDVFKNVTALDKGARESITNFEQGVGDAAITYENEVLVAKKGGQKYDFVIPRSTILIENPVAVVDANVDKHGTRAVAEAFRDFLFTQEAQAIFAEYGLRPVHPEVAKATAGQYPPPQDLFLITDLGGWKTVTPKFFGADGIFTQLLEQVQAEK